MFSNNVNRWTGTKCQQVWRIQNNFKIKRIQFTPRISKVIRSFQGKRKAQIRRTLKITIEEINRRGRIKIKTSKRIDKTKLRERRRKEKCWFGNLEKIKNQGRARREMATYSWTLSWVMWFEQHTH